MTDEYIKDFKKWLDVKSNTQDKDADSVLVREKSVWLTRFGVNIGSEMDGKGEYFTRPVIILKKINSDVFLCVPVSSKMHEDKYRIPFLLGGEQRVAVISQIRVLDRKRCVRFMTFITEKEFEEILYKMTCIFKAETPQPQYD